MKKYRIIRQILLILVVLFGISFFTFLLTYLTPGDPVRTMFLASGSMPSDEVIEATRAEMGLDKPF